MGELTDDYVSWMRQQRRVARQTPDRQAMTHAGDRPAEPFRPEPMVRAPVRFMGERYEIPGTSIPERNAEASESLSQIGLPQGPGDLALGAVLGPLGRPLGALTKAGVAGAGLAMDPDRAEAMFLGFNRAKMPPRGALSEALRMRGRTPESRMWEDTGVMFGPDGKPRWEIDDSNAKFVLPPEGSSRRLDSVYGNDELFRQYPRLSSVKVGVEDPGDPRIAGYYDPAARRIVVSPYGGDPEKTIVHEVQHGVQDMEGHTGGALPDLLTTYKTLPMRQRRLELYDKYQRAGLAGMTGSEIDELKLLQEQLKALEHPAAQRVFYDHAFGEAEARNTENRLALDDYYRRQTYPGLTMDVPMRETYAHPSIRDMTKAVERYNVGVRGLSPSMPEGARDRLMQYARELESR